MAASSGKGAAGVAAWHPDADGRLHVERIKAIPEPGSLIDLRKRVTQAQLSIVALAQAAVRVTATSGAGAPCTVQLHFAR